MNPPLSTKFPAVSLLTEAIAHNTALAGQPDARKHFDLYGAAPAFEAASKAFTAALDAFQPEAKATFGRWAEPFFGTDEEGRALAREAFAASQFGKALVNLGGEPSAPGYVSRINVLVGKFDELDRLQTVVATINAKL